MAFVTSPLKRAMEEPLTRPADFMASTRDARVFAWKDTGKSNFSIVPFKRHSFLTQAILLGRFLKFLLLFLEKNCSIKKSFLIIRNDKCLFDWIYINQSRHEGLIS